MRTFFPSPCRQRVKNFSTPKLLKLLSRNLSSSILFCKSRSNIPLKNMVSTPNLTNLYLRFIANIHSIMYVGVQLRLFNNSKMYILNLESVPQTVPAVKSSPSPAGSSVPVIYRLSYNPHNAGVLDSLSEP